jgi:aspartate-semialdehyde dehydrogenase
MARIRCAVVGATGIAGQEFIAALASHPFIEITRLAASERSANKSYQEAIRSSAGATAWYVDEPIPPAIAAMKVEDAKNLIVDDLDLVFSAIDAEPARELEPRYAAKVPVISTASAFRYEHDVPLIIPGVNGAHAELLRVQRSRRGWKGYIVPIPNCTTTGLAIALAPLHRKFGVDKVVMTSLQATSGAGRSPGVIALDIVDNVVPFIPKEEDKVETETKKILGILPGGAEAVEPAPFAVSATCTRVAVLEGHTEAVTCAFRSAPAGGLAEVREALQSFGGEVSRKTHPSAPDHWITLHDDPYRPQPRRDREADRGMTTSVGRLREDKVLGPHGVRFVLVSHNTKMGAAMGAVLVAEDLRQRGFL